MVEWRFFSIWDYGIPLAFKCFPALFTKYQWVYPKPQPFISRRRIDVKRVILWSTSNQTMSFIGSDWTLLTQPTEYFSYYDFIAMTVAFLNCLLFSYKRAGVMFGGRRTISQPPNLFGVGASKILQCLQL